MKMTVDFAAVAVSRVGKYHLFCSGISELAFFLFESCGVAHGGPLLWGGGTSCILHVASKNAVLFGKVLCKGSGCLDPTHLSSSRYVTGTCCCVTSLPHVQRAGGRRLVPCGNPRSKLESEGATAGQGRRNSARQTFESVSAAKTSPGPFMPLAVGTDTTCNTRL